jgi:pilus assembly protein CpaC
MQTILLGQVAAQYGVAGAGVQEKTLQGPMGFILD